MHSDDLLNSTRAEMARMTPDQRLKFTSDLLKGYCKYCGDNLSKQIGVDYLICNCSNDA